MTRFFMKLRSHDGEPYSVECDENGANVTVDKIKHPEFPSALFPQAEREKFEALIKSGGLKI